MLSVCQVKGLEKTFPRCSSPSQVMTTTTRSKGNEAGGLMCFAVLSTLLLKLGAELWRRQRQPHASQRRKEQPEGTIQAIVW